MDESILSGESIAEAIAKLREHPEIISAVSSALSGGREETREKPEEPSAVSAPQSPFPIEKLSEVMTTLAPMLSGTSSPVGKEITGNREDHRYALLCALRPYLSTERREMVDYLLRFGKIGDLLKKIK